MNKSLIRKNQLHPDITDLVGQYGSGYFVSDHDSKIVYTTGTQTISGNKSFAANEYIFSGTNVSFPNTPVTFDKRPTVNGSGVLLSGDLFIPAIATVTSNFTISPNYNGRIIVANTNAQITGTILTNNMQSYNVSIIQGGNGQVRITGVSFVNILSYYNQYKTAGRGATISLLHTGNDGYVMYGNTSL